MTKKILLLFDDDSVSHKKADPQALIGLFNDAANGTAGYDFSLYSDLGFFLNGDKASIIDMKKAWDITNFDLVYHRRWGHAAEEAVVSAMYLSKKKVAFIDSELNRPGSMGKLAQSWRMWQHDLPVPPTVFVPKKYVKAWLNETNLQKSGIKYPFILKDRAGTRGANNYLVKTKAEALKILEANKKLDFVIQYYVPNKKDYRVLVAGDNLSMVIERQAAAGSHKNNTSQGAKATLIEANTFSNGVRSDIIKVARAFDREIAGVDIVFDDSDGRHYFFEVNRSPQIESSSYSSDKAKRLHNFFMEITDGKVQY